MIEIKDRYSGEVICGGETLREAAESHRADLYDASLRGVSLRYADLYRADLRGANLRGAKLCWHSRELLAEVLLRAAGGDIDKLKIAGFVLICREKCWSAMIELAANDPLGGWALDTLAGWVREGDNAPAIMRERAKRLAALKGAE